jgi:hypothetical protein
VLIKLLKIFSSLVDAPDPEYMAVAIENQSARVPDAAVEQI